MLVAPVLVAAVFSLVAVFAFVAAVFSRGQHAEVSPRVPGTARL
jgi:hypothetical protein